MTYIEFLDKSIQVHTDSIERRKLERPLPRSFIAHLKGVLAGLKIARRIATFNNIDGTVKTYFEGSPWLPLD
jgi:hypothetical protein